MRVLSATQTKYFVLFFSCRHLGPEAYFRLGGLSELGQGSAKAERITRSTLHYSLIVTLQRWSGLSQDAFCRIRPPQRTET